MIKTPWLYLFHPKSSSGEKSDTDFLMGFCFAHIFDNTDSSSFVSWNIYLDKVKLFHLIKWRPKCVWNDFPIDKLILFEILNKYNCVTWRNRGTLFAHCLRYGLSLISYRSRKGKKQKFCWSWMRLNQHIFRSEIENGTDYSTTQFTARIPDEHPRAHLIEKKRTLSGIFGTSQTKICYVICFALGIEWLSKVNQMDDEKKPLFWFSMYFFFLFWWIE